MHRFASLFFVSFSVAACAESAPSSGPAPSGVAAANTFSVVLDGAPFLVQRCQSGTVRVKQASGEEELAGYWLTDASGRQVQLASQASKPNVTVTEADKRSVTLQDVCSISATKADGVETVTFDCRGSGRHIAGTAKIAGCEALVASR